MNKTKAIRIIKAADSARYKIALKRERAFFMPFIKRGEQWSELAPKHAAVFALTLDSLLKRYRRECIKLIRGVELYSGTPVKKNKTNEQTDERYDRVVVPDVRDVLAEMTSTLEADLKREYEKQIATGFVPEAAELIYESSGMDFNFNKFHESTRDYLRDKTIKWAKQVASETERIVKRELIKGFEEGYGSYEIASNLEKATGFSFSRCEAIARTEIASAGAYTEYMERLANPNVIGTKWHIADNKARTTHKEADGQERKLGEPFNIGPHKMYHPRDSSLDAPAGEIINCRCFTTEIRRDTPIDSKTIYDEPDTGSDDWLKRQSDDFREEYIGGKVKARLFEADLIGVEDSKTPLTEILPKVYPVKTTTAQLRRVSSLTESAAKSAINKANALWLYGKLQNREANSTINAETGAKAYKNIIGEHGRITDDSEDVRKWLKYLDRAESRSVVTIHNHNNTSTFSLSDLKLFLSKDSIRTMVVIDDDGNMFLLEKKPGVVYNADEIINEFGTELTVAYERIRGLGIWDNLKAAEKDEWKISMYNAVLKRYLKVRDFRYGGFKGKSHIM